MMRTASLVLGLCGVAGGQESLELGATDGTVLDYLLERYDKNGDGQISAGEYARSAEHFQRLDWNRDGKIDIADFDPDRPFMMDRATIVARLMTQAFSEKDPAGEELDFDTFDQAVTSYDGDEDGFVSKEEFAAGFAERGGADESMDHYSMMVEDVDQDQDGALALEELTGWFDAQDEDSDLVLTGNEVRALMFRRMSSRNRDKEPVADDAPNARGKVAPDFELRPPDGGEPVRLSSFAGKRPVALIFGSYT